MMIKMLLTRHLKQERKRIKTSRSLWIQGIRIGIKNTQALKYLQPVFMPIVRDKMKSLQLQSMTDFGRQLCAEATADDIILVNGRLAQFKHLCPGTVVACQNLLNIIKGHTSDSVNFYQMLKGTDPQQWLKSPFEFVRLFLKDWMRCDIHDFQECDITALCTIVKRCKPLMQIFDERKIDDLRKVRNWTMHPATMSISRQEMENNIDVILDFLEHIKSLKSTDEVTEAIESIKQLRTGDVRLLHSMVVRLIQGWLPCARIVYEHKSEQAKNQLQDINYMETMLARLSSGQEITSLRQSAEHELEVKTEDKRELEIQNEELIKRLKEDKRELKKQNEELSKRLQEEKRELEKQNEELSKRLNKEKRELEKQNDELRKRLETNERRSFGEVCPTKEMSTQRSPDGALEVEISPKRTASGGERFSSQAFSASTSSGDEHETVREEVSKPWSTYGNLRKILSLPVMSCDEQGTLKEGSPYGNLRKIVSLPEMLGFEHPVVKKELSKQGSPYGNLRKPVSLPEMLGDGHETVKEGSPYGNLRKTVSLPEMLGDEHETVKEELSKQRSPYSNLRKIFFLSEISGDEHKGVKEIKKMNVRTSSDPYVREIVCLLGAIRPLRLLCMLCLLCVLSLFCCVGLLIGSWNQRSLYDLDISLCDLSASLDLLPSPLPSEKKLYYHRISGDEHATVKEYLCKQWYPYGNLKKTVCPLEMLGDGHETVKKELSKAKPPSDSPRKALLTRKG